MSTDGGSTWSVSLAATSLVSKFSMTLTSLNGTKMLFVFNGGADADLKYVVFDGSTWGGVNTVSAGIATGIAKQLSSVTVNGTKQAYVAFLTGGYQGTLKVARFSGNGVFEAIETADSTLTHQLPAISVTYDDVIRINTVSNNIVYEIKKNSSGWQAPTTPLGTTFDIADQITAPTIGLINAGVSFTQGPGAFDLFFFPFLDPNPAGGIWNCPTFVTNADPCFPMGQGPLDGTEVQTPLGVTIVSRACPSDKSSRCAPLIDHFTNHYPPSFPAFFLGDLPFKHGRIYGCVTAGLSVIRCYFNPQSDSWIGPDSGLDNDGTGSLKFYAFQLDKPATIFMLYTYGEGFFSITFELRINLIKGYVAQN